MGRELCFAFGIVLAVILTTHSARAGEFGNIFGEGETQKQSRVASAEALAAIASIIAGLRERELEIGSGRESFLTASEQFINAAAQMDSLIGDNFPKVNLGINGLSWVQNFFSPDYMPELETATTLQEVYMGFSRETRDMGVFIAELANADMSRNLSFMHWRLSRYFDFARLVVQIQQF